MKIKTVVSLGLLVGVSSCVQTETKNNYQVDSSVSTIYFPSKVALRAFGETEIWNYKKYNFYLLYLDHRPWRTSAVFSLRIEDSVLYSYTKYMDGVVSTNYPPYHYLENKDSIFFTTMYQEHKLPLLNEIRKKLDQSNFYKINTEKTMRKNESHDSRWLIVYDESKSIHSVFNWQDTGVENLISYIKDSLMKR